MLECYDSLKQNSARLKSDFFQISFNKKTLITYSVDNTTIRAVRNCKKYKPLSLFRAWANDFLSNQLTIDLINARGEFNSFRILALNSLNEFWNTKDESQLPKYLLNKFIDLFIKFLPLWAEVNAESKKWLFENANVPLDLHSLSYLRKYRPDLAIPKNASMRHVKNDEMYERLQSEIKNLCSDIPPIIFDLLAFEKSHNYFELKELDLKSPGHDLIKPQKQ